MFGRLIELTARVPYAWVLCGHLAVWVWFLAMCKYWECRGRYKPKY